MPEQPVDPYVPPTSDWTPPGSLPRSEHLKDPRLWAHLCCWPYGISLALDLLQQLFISGGFTAAPVWESYLRQTHAAARISAALFFFCWVYRVAWNAKMLAPPQTTVEPGGIVGSFFIPFFNLVVPWQQMKRIAKISSGASMETHVNVWWTTVAIAYLIPFHIYIIMAIFEDHLPDSLRASSGAGYWGSDYPNLSRLPFYLVTITGITMVMRLTRAQDQARRGTQA
jgi:hypothetical protein